MATTISASPALACKEVAVHSVLPRTESTVKASPAPSLRLPSSFGLPQRSALRGFRCVSGRPCATSSLSQERRVLRKSALEERLTTPEDADSDVKELAEAETEPPTINLRFIGPGEKQVASFSIGSGEKNLRRAMIDSKTPLYDMYGSLMNCGGGGSCGTCLVEVREGAQLLSGRTDAEDRYLKKRPSTWRLACQTIVGDKTNSGDLVVRTIPQKK